MSGANEPAFPQIETEPAYTDNGRGDMYPNTYSTGGLTKREHFAAMAMQGMAMRVTGIFDHEVAAAAVSLADALLAELEKSK